MGLKKYHAKRKFSETPEPKGKVKRSSRGLRFVIQKHAATRLHYDFRLELDGVLKSWAVPKGPSLNTTDKRLAMMVEDHPYDYRNFEGIIPKGNYGAGTVIIWDEGNYLALGSHTADESEKILRAGLKKGEIKFVLNGKKLKGGFALIKMHGRGENAWLLIKEKDSYVKNVDITKKDKSVRSNKNLDQMAKGKPKIWRSNK